MADYRETVDYILGIPLFAQKIGKENLSSLLCRLGNPEREVPCIHVAGTNGKGSTCRALSQMLMEAGYKVGLFTSPHLVSIYERIQINGVNISDEDFVTAFETVKEKFDVHPSFFEVMFAMAAVYFREKHCDVVVYETGMGGRLDATNIITTPICCALTSISLDHTAYLGDTLEEISKEKCGIIKEGVPVVTAPNEAVIDIIRAEAEAMGAPLVITEAKESPEYTVALKGEYQKQNMAVAVDIINVLIKAGFDINEGNIRDGLKNVKWQGRYEFITPDIIIDGGHNPDGVRMLKKSLIKEGRPITLVMGMCADKDYKECILDLAPVAEKVIATELKMERALSAEEIKAQCDIAGVSCDIEKDIKVAIDKAIATGNLVCICGSLYLAGEARGILKN